MADRSIAIVGSGISGLSAAWHLSENNKILLFEKGDRLGGHTHTHIFNTEDEQFSVDSGFIVFNKVNYPNFTSWIRELNVKESQSDMSFSVSRAGGKFEWGGSSIFSVFGQKRNLASPRFLKMLFEVIKFNKLAKEFIQKEDVYQHKNSLDSFLSERNFSQFFVRNYLAPIAGSIWSTPGSKIADYPTISILQFFNNHGLLSVSNHHQWFHLSDGSSSYIKQLFKHERFRKKDIKVLKNHRVDYVEPIKNKREGLKISLDIENLEKKEKYTIEVDELIFACHANETLLCLNDSRPEYSLLKRIRFQKNVGYLHNDRRLMPKRKSVWSAWNYIASEECCYDENISVTYWMNKLQDLRTSRNIFVSLNPLLEPNESMYKKKLVYDHPVFDQDMIDAREKLLKIQGLDNIWHSGAWTGNGFHEDGFVSGKKVAAAINDKTN
mgnify:FL=1